MTTTVDNPIDDETLKSLFCGLETPFPMTLQERLQLFYLLDNAVFAIRSGFAELLEIQPAAYPVFEGLHAKFVQSFHAGSVPAGAYQPISSTHQ